MKYKFINIPQFFEKSEYLNTINKVVESLKIQNGVRSIYQMGNINHPGISDIDIIVVFEDKKLIDYNLRNLFSNVNNYLFTHNLGGITKSHFNQITKYSFFHNLNCLWGEEFNLEKGKLNTKEIEALQIQTALEFLVSNYISLTVQLKYGVIKLRALLQHIKAIKYDFEFLKITSGKLNKMLNQLFAWLDSWFIQPIDLTAFCEWVEEFYIELKEFLKIILQDRQIYIPKWANLKYSPNIKIELGKSIRCEFFGFFLPKFLSGISKKTYNLNTRFNSFIFRIPFSNITKDKIKKERLDYYKEIKKCASKYYPQFTPLIPDFVARIM